MGVGTEERRLRGGQEGVKEDHVVQRRMHTVLWNRTSLAARGLVAKLAFKINRSGICHRI